MALSFDTSVDAAIVNGGSIRLDDMLDGEITSLDIFRVLPFGGTGCKSRNRRSLVARGVRLWQESFGEGAYLQRYNIYKNSDRRMGDRWSNQSTIRTYKIACTGFFMKGLDIPILKTGVEGLISCVLSFRG